MSGPKKADVKAALNIARQAQRRGAELLGATHRSALHRSVQRARARQAAAGDQRAEVEEALSKMAHDVLRLAAPSVQSAMDASRGAASLLERSAQQILASHEHEQLASQRELAARNAYEAAEREYQRASKALGSSGDHYLQREMEWAQKARLLFDEAAAQLCGAKDELRIAQQGVAQAEALAIRAERSLDEAADSLRQARQQTAKRILVEQEAKRIAEVRLRAVTLELEAARAAVARVLELPVRRFEPREEARLNGALAKADELISSGEVERASELARRLSDEAEGVRRKVVAAQQHHAEAVARARVAASMLESDLSDARDSELAQWFEPDVLRVISEQQLRGALAALDDEQPGDAERLAGQGQAALGSALEAAAECLSARERRDRIGSAVMEALDEMGFDVSFEAGDHQNPMRISGMTPDEHGRGDFDIEIPLDGELDFEVSAQAGDGSCVAAIGTLTERLAAMGIDWTTTDWGHADPKSSAARQQKTKVGTERVKVKNKY
jgi:hypothetical protein